MKLGIVWCAAFYLLLTFQAMAQYFDPYYDGRYDYEQSVPYEDDGPYYERPPAPRSYDRAPLYDEGRSYDRRSTAQDRAGSIVIVTGEHTLYYTAPTGVQFAYPIAVGREGKQWFGTTRVVSKKQHPEWRPTAEMRRKNPKLPEVVRPGPSNPLGTRALYLADGLLRIHGTNDPSSIGTNASSGCFRMYREDVEQLYEMVRAGTPVTVHR